MNEEVKETGEIAEETISDKVKPNAKFCVGIALLRGLLDEHINNELNSKRSYRDRYSKTCELLCNIFEKYFNSSWFNLRYGRNTIISYKYKNEPDFGMITDIPNSEVTYIIDIVDLKNILSLDALDSCTYDHVCNLLHNFNESDRSLQYFKLTSEYAEDIDLFRIELAKSMNKRFRIIVNPESFKCSSFRFKIDNQTFRFTFKFVK